VLIGLDRFGWPSMKTCALLAAFIASVVASAYLRLIFTLPVISLGLFALLWPLINRDKLSKPILLSLINTGAVLLCAGLSVTLFNALEAFRSTTPSTRRIYTADYGTPRTEGAWLSGSSEPLGYRYKEGLSPMRSRLIEQETGKVIYDVTYSFNDNGLRKTFDKGANTSNTALFLGGSFTFGEGLDDNESLPSQFSQLTGWKSINAGMHGYGSHQALQALRDNPTYSRITGGSGIDLVVYRVMNDHANRADGMSDWDKYGPCFNLTPRGVVEYQGTFSECKKRLSISSALRNTLNFLTKTKEPFSRILLKRLNNTLFREQAEKRQIAIITEMQRLSKSRSSQLVVVIENLISPHNNTRADKGAGCHMDSRMNLLASELVKRGIATVKISDITSDAECSSGRLSIPNDGHPSGYANKKVAYALAKSLIKTGSGF